jgi:hypothetical protein
VLRRCYRCNEAKAKDPLGRIMLCKHERVKADIGKEKDGGKGRLGKQINREFYTFLDRYLKMEI